MQLKHMMLLLHILLFASSIVFSQGIIIDHNCADNLKIPNNWVNETRAIIKLHYAHTSHGGQLTTGIARLSNPSLPVYDSRLEYTLQYNSLPSSLDLCIMDGQLTDTYITPDLYWQSGGIAFTKNTLNTYPAINVSMWSWCCQLDYYSESEVNDYLQKVSQLEQEHPNVIFVYMTGNAQSTGEDGYNRYLRNEQIRLYCKNNNKVLFDFADLDSWYNGEQETYYYSGQYIPREHPQYQGDQANHTTFSSCENKGRALWWLLARLAGWEGFQQSEDVLGSWDSTGVWYRNSISGAWVKLANPALTLAAGDLDGDGTDDMIGSWLSGLWVKYSSTGEWTKLSSSVPIDIASGDMNGDGRDDVVGTWTDSGVWYRNSISGIWVKITTYASQIAVGDINKDNYDDLIGVWSSGVWLRNSSSGTWTWISTSLPNSIASGDMTGDGRDDVVASWSGSGVWYRNSMNGAWVKIAAAANRIAAGIMDGDQKSDLIGVWSSGLWIKHSSTMSWERLTTSLPRDIDAGYFRD